MSQPVEDFYGYREQLHGEKHRLETTDKAKDWVGLVEGFDKAAAEMGKLRKAARQASSDAERQAYTLEIQDIAIDLNKDAREAGMK